MAEEIPDITVAVHGEGGKGDVSAEATKDSPGDTTSKTSKTGRTSKTSASSLTTAPPTQDTEETDTEFESRGRTEDDVDKSEWGEDEMDEGEETFLEGEEEEEEEEGAKGEMAEGATESAETDVGQEMAGEGTESEAKKVKILQPVSEEERGEEDMSDVEKVVKAVTDEVLGRATGQSRMSKLQDVVDSQEPVLSDSDEETTGRKGSEASISQSLSHQLDSIEKEDKLRHGLHRRSGALKAGGQRRPSMTLAPSEAEEQLTIQEPEEMPEYPWEGSCSSSSTSTPSAGADGQTSMSLLTEVEQWSREVALEQYKKLARDKFVLKRKNMVLMKRVGEFFKIKKWDIYTDDTGVADPQQEARYQAYMKQFEEYTKREVEVRDNVNVKLAEMERKLQETENLEQEVLDEIMNRQREVALGLISDRTGKPLANKILERLITRQITTMEDLKHLRTKYIKIRDAYNSKEMELKNLEMLGEGLYLKDYEQLRMENQSYCDKIEERDEELTQLRNRATSSIQVLAHIREKANYTANTIQELYEDLEFSEYEANRNREYVGTLKKQRDDLRAELKELRDSSGLLVHKRLVEDFERSLALSQQLTAEIKALKSYYAEGIIALEKARMGDDWRRSHLSTATRILAQQRMRQSVGGGTLPHWSKAAKQASIAHKSQGTHTRSKRYKRHMNSEIGDKPSLRRENVAEITKTRPAFFPPIKHSLLEYF